MNNTDKLNQKKTNQYLLEKANEIITKKDYKPASYIKIPMDELKTFEEIKEIQSNPTSSAENNDQLSFINIYNY